MATTDQTAWRGSRSRSLSRKHLQTLATLSVLVLMCLVFTLLSDRFLTLFQFPEPDAEHRPAGDRRVRHDRGDDRARH